MLVFSYHAEHRILKYNNFYRYLMLTDGSQFHHRHLENMNDCEQVIDDFLAEDTSMILECIIDPMDLVAY